MKILDVITLSSTHLLFLKELLKKEFSKILLDMKIYFQQKFLQKLKINNPDITMKIFTSSDVINFKNKLNKIGIKNKVNFLST